MTQGLDFNRTTVNPEEEKNKRPRRQADDIIEQLQVIKRRYRDARWEKENKWLEAWGQYFSTPEAQAFMRARALHTVGDVNTDWRHRVPDGKAFEMVESVTNFLMGAFFPNKNWFDVEPKEPLDMEPEDYRKYIRTMKEFVNRKLQEGDFQDHWEQFVRQAVAVGTSAIALPWRYITEQKPMNVRVPKPDGNYTVETKNVDKTKYNGFDFETISMFDFFIDPNAETGNDGNILRRYEKTRGELIRDVEAGRFPKTSVKAIQDMEAKERSYDESDTKEYEKEHFQGMNTHVTNPEDIIEVWEFWGDITINGVEYQDVVITYAGDEVLEFQSNPFWGGKPFITCTFLPVLNTPYGLGVLDPVLGDLHAKMLTRNQRLDIVEGSINPMFEVVNDGTIDFSNLTVEPGKMIPVAEPNSIRQINTVANVASSVQEEQLMEQSIEKATGTGAFIGSGATRNAERVTAQEIQATRQAGGNRLNGVHRHMEREGMLAFLTKAFRFMQQFMTVDEVIPVSSEEDPEAKEFMDVGIEELNQELHLRPLGSDFIINEEHELKQRTDFLTLAGQIEPMQQTLNWKEIAKDLARRFLKEDWQNYIKEDDGGATPPSEALTQQQQGGEPGAGAQLQGGAAPQTEIEQLKQGALSAGGEGAAQAIEEQVRAGQGQEALSQLAQNMESQK